MNEQLHSLASNYLFAIPIVLLLTYVWLRFEKSRAAKSSKSAKSYFDNAFIMRHALFVAALAFLLIMLNKPLPGLEESIIVSPADF